MRGRREWGRGREGKKGDGAGNKIHAAADVYGHVVYMQAVDCVSHIPDYKSLQIFCEKDRIALPCCHNIK